MTNQTVERQTSRLLIDEEPLQVLPSLATQIGLNEALILQQLHYWLRNCPHQHLGGPWIYNSYPQWHKQLPFWSEHTIRRIVAALKKRGLIHTESFNGPKGDRTMWYTINYAELAALQTAPGPTPRTSVHNGHMGTSAPQGTAPHDAKTSGDFARPSVQLGHIMWPSWPHQDREGSTEIPPSGGGSTPPPNNHGYSQQPRKPPTPTKSMPPDYEPSATLRAELEAKYPALNFAEELDRIRECVELTRPTADWDVATRRLFRRAEDHRKKGIAPPAKGNGDTPYGPEVIAAISTTLEQEAATPRKDHDR